jgi:hypothetical protein
VWAGNIVAPSLQLITSSAGFALDPGNISTLWQDVTGTTPVTAAGQSVARIDDASGNFNHAAQSVVSAQPTYQIDANGAAYLLFDGVDDFLVTPTINLSAVSSAFTLFAMQREGSLQTDVALEQTAAFSGTPGAVLLNMTSSQLRANVSGTAGNTVSVLETTTERLNVYSAQHDFAATTLEAAIYKFRRNRQDSVSISTYAGVAAPSSVGASAEFYIAARGGTSLFYTGRFYGAVVRGGVVSDNQHRGLEDYYMRRAGLV